MTRSDVAESAEVTAAIRTANVVYALMAAAPLLWFAPVVAIVVAYAAERMIRDAWITSHLMWQRRTFWYALIWVLIGSMTAHLLVGFVVWAVALIWFIYRIARGWLLLNQRLPCGSFRR